MSISRSPWGRQWRRTRHGRGKDWPVPRPYRPDLRQREMPPSHYPARPPLAVRYPPCFPQKVWSDALAVKKEKFNAASRRDGNRGRKRADRLERKPGLGDERRAAPVRDKASRVGNRIDTATQPRVWI